MPPSQQNSSTPSVPETGGYTDAFDLYRQSNNASDTTLVPRQPESSAASRAPTGHKALTGLQSLMESALRAEHLPDSVTGDETLGGVGKVGYCWNTPNKRYGVGFKEGWIRDWNEETKEGMESAVLQRTNHASKLCTEGDKRWKECFKNADEIQSLIQPIDTAVSALGLTPEGVRRLLSETSRDFFGQPLDTNVSRRMDPSHFAQMHRKMHGKMWPDSNEAGNTLFATLTQILRQKEDEKEEQSRQSQVSGKSTAESCFEQGGRQM